MYEIDEQMVTMLVQTPLIIGMMMGMFWGSFPARAKLYNVFCAIVVCAAVPGWMQSNVSSFAGLEYGAIRIVGTLVIWGGLGWGIGRNGKQYTLLLGIAASLLTATVVTIAVCLSFLVSETLLASWIAPSATAVHAVFKAYLASALVGVVLVAFFSRWRNPIQSAKSLANTFLKAFSIVSVASFLSMYIAEKTLSDLLWLLPNIAPPASYSLVFSLAIGFTAAFFFPLPPLGAGRIAITPDTGVLIARNRLGLIESAPPITLKLIYFTIEGIGPWKKKSEKLTDLRYDALFRPSETWMRQRLGRLDLCIFQYDKSTIDNEERFKEATRVNLLGQPGCEITEDKIDSRHGVMSHECSYRVPGGYGHVIRFILFHNEFVITWFSVSKEMFTGYLNHVHDFANSLHFASAVAENK